MLLVVFMLFALVIFPTNTAAAVQLEDYYVNTFSNIEPMQLLIFFILLFVIAMVLVLLILHYSGYDVNGPLQFMLEGSKTFVVIAAPILWVLLKFVCRILLCSMEMFYDFMKWLILFNYYIIKQLILFLFVNIKLFIIPLILLLCFYLTFFIQSPQIITINGRGPQECYYISGVRYCNYDVDYQKLEVAVELLEQQNIIELGYTQGHLYNISHLNNQQCLHLVQKCQHSLQPRLVVKPNILKFLNCSVETYMECDSIDFIDKNLLLDSYIVPGISKISGIVMDELDYYLKIIRFVILLIVLLYQLMMNFSGKFQMLAATRAKSSLESKILKNKIVFTISAKMQLLFKLNYFLTQLPIVLILYLSLLKMCEVLVFLQLLLTIIVTIVVLMKLNNIDHYINLNQVELSELYQQHNLNIFNKLPMQRQHVIGELPLKDKTMINEVFNNLVGTQNTLTKMQLFNFIAYYGDNYLYAMISVMDEYFRMLPPVPIVFQQPDVFQPINSQIYNYLNIQVLNMQPFEIELKELHEIINAFNLQNGNINQIIHYYFRCILALSEKIRNEYIDEVQFIINNDIKPLISQFGLVQPSYFKVFDVITNQLKTVRLYRNQDIELQLLYNGNGIYTCSLINNMNPNGFIDDVFMKLEERIIVDDLSEKTVNMLYKDKVNHFVTQKNNRIQEHSTSHALSRIEHHTIRQYGNNGSHLRILDVGTNFCGTMLGMGIVYNLANLEQKDTNRIMNYQHRLVEYLRTNVSQRITIYFGDITKINFKNCNISTAYLHNCIYNIDLLSYAAVHAESEFEQTITNTQIPHNVLAGTATYDIDNEMQWRIVPQFWNNFSSLSQSRYKLVANTQNEFFEHNVSTLFDWFYLSAVMFNLNRSFKSFKSTVERQIHGYYTVKWTINDLITSTVDQLVTNTNYYSCVMVDDDEIKPREIIYFSRDIQSCEQNITDSFLLNVNSPYLDNERAIYNFVHQNCDMYKKIQTSDYKEIMKVLDKKMINSGKYVLQLEKTHNIDKRIIKYTNCSIKTAPLPKITVDNTFVYFDKRISELLLLMQAVDAKSNFSELMETLRQFTNDLFAVYGTMVIELPQLKITYKDKKCKLNTIYHYGNVSEEQGEKQHVICTSFSALFITLWNCLSSHSVIESTDLLQQYKTQISIDKTVKSNIYETNTKNVVYRDELGNIIDINKADSDSSIQTVVDEHENEISVNDGWLQGRNVSTLARDINEDNTIDGFTTTENKERKIGKQAIVTMEPEEITLDNQVNVNLQDDSHDSDDEDKSDEENKLRKSDEKGSNDGSNDNDGDDSQPVIDLNEIDENQQGNNQLNGRMYQSAGRARPRPAPPFDPVVRGNEQESKRVHSKEKAKMKKLTDKIEGSREHKVIDHDETGIVTNNKHDKNSQVSFKNHIITNQTLRKPMILKEEINNERELQSEMANYPFTLSSVEEAYLANGTGQWQIPKYRSLLVLDLENGQFAGDNVTISDDGRIIALKAFRYFASYDAFNNDRKSMITVPKQNQSHLKTLIVIKQNNQYLQISFEECVQLLRDIQLQQVSLGSLLN